jgi:hypothetical protein
MLMVWLAVETIDFSSIYDKTEETGKDYFLNLTNVIDLP